MAEIIANRELLRSVRAKLNATINPYGSRNEFENSQIPAAVSMVYVIDGGDIYRLARDPSGSWIDGAGGAWVATVDAAVPAGQTASDAAAAAASASEAAVSAAAAASDLVDVQAAVSIVGASAATAAAAASAAEATALAFAEVAADQAATAAQAAATDANLSAASAAESAETAQAAATDANLSAAAAAGFAAIYAQSRNAYLSGSVVRLASVSGDGQAVTGAIPAGLMDFVLQVGVEFSVVWPAANTGPAPTLAVTDPNGTYTMALQTATGGALAAGDLRAGGLYMIRMTSNTTARVHGALSLDHLAETSSAVRVSAVQRENLDRLESAAYISSGPLSYISSGELFNGAVLYDAGRGVAVPTGSTGRNSYRRWQISGDDLAAIKARAGEIVDVIIEIELSAGLVSASPITVNFSTQIGATWNNTAAAVVILSQSSTSIVCRARYTILGTESQIAPWVQVSASASVRVTDGYFAVSKIYAKWSGENGADTAFDWRAERAIAAAVPVIVDSRIGGLSDAVAQSQITSGPLPYTNEGEALNGAVVSGGGKGLTIPAGQHGRNAYRRAVAVMPPPAGAGQVVTFRAVLAVTAGVRTDSPFTARLAVRNGTTLNNNAATATVTDIDSTHLLVEAAYTLVGDETRFDLWFQFSGSAAVRTTSGSVTFEEMSFVMVGSRGRTSADLMLDYRVSDATAAIPEEIAAVTARGAVYIKTVNVAADGSGDYLSLTAAFAAEGGGINAAKRVLYRLSEGVYTDINVDFPNFVDVVGIGRRDHIWYKGELPASVDPAQVPLNETFKFDLTSTIRNLRVSCKNMRYPIHSETGASANRAIQQVIGCLVENYGNQEVIDYQVGLGNAAPALWGSAMGCGGHSGFILRSKDTIWRAPLGPFFVHSNADFAEPMEIVLEGGAAINTRDGHSVSLQPMGAGVVTHTDIIGCDLAGPIYVDGGANWLTTALARQWGNRLAEFVTTVRACGPVLARGNNGASVLELRSAAGVGSAVAVSGSAAPILFGAQPDYRRGAADHAGRVYSQHAITGSAAGVSLAARLGNRSASPLTLTVAFDGAAPVNLTLSANYTGMTNAAVISDLNSLLANGSRGFYQTDPYSGGGCVRMPDYDREVKNVGTATIKRGMAAAQDGSSARARVATSADPAWRVIGIALEDIIPGATGRLRGKGALIDVGDVLFDGIPSISEGDVFGVSTSLAGAISEGVAVPVLRSVWTYGYSALEVL